MTDEHWLRDALRRATAHQPVGEAARADGALRIAVVRKRQRVAMASFAAVLAVFVATSLSTGSTRGLEPASPTRTPSASETPASEETPGYGPDPGESYIQSPEPDPERTQVPPEPLPNEHRVPPKAIDVYFLVDYTGAMSSATVDPAVHQIISGLRARGDDVRYGFGITRDYSGPAYDAMFGGAIYERFAKIQPDPGEFSLGNHGGGGDDPDGQTYGLMGTTGWYDGVNIKESQPAGFRAGSTRFVVLITDAPMHSGRSPGYYGADVDYPTIEQATDALRAQGVFGAAVQIMGNSDEDATRADLDKVATRTGAIAGHDVDCEGDGFEPGWDVRRGESLICRSWWGADHDLSGFGRGLLRFALDQA